ncbi:TolC family outer membrane protein [Sulfurimonas sp.]|uniref:TolC family outer membrane protein n=1 Tax=Sulfurimonas sp. TaxID=2022749 RepID=UPI00260C021C|nr:TolC family outer membrane protein [Sulfurimonas sp.]
MKKLLFIPFMFVISSSVSALTLQKTVSEVLATHPVIQQQLKNYRATREDMSIADSDYMPTVDIVGGAGWKTKGHLANQPDYNDHRAYNSAVIVKQNLFNGFKTLYSVAYEKARVVAAAYNYVEKADDVTLQTTKAYLDLLRAYELYKVVKENVAENELIYSKVYELYVSGAAAKSELDKIQSSLSLSRSNLTVRRNNLVDARFALHEFLGRAVSVEALEKPAFTAKLPSSRIRAMQFAFEHNPSLLVSRFNIKAAQKKYKQSRQNYYPSVDLEAAQYYSDNWQTSVQQDDRFEVMLNVTYNLYNGGKDSARKQKNISLVSEEVDKQRELKRKLIHSLGVSWSSYEIIGMQLNELYKFQSFSFSTLNLYKKEYELGQRSLLDLLAAQNDYFGAQAQIINAQYDQLYAKYRILDAMGVLVVALLGEDTDYYKTVGLENGYKDIKDKLPVNLDVDNDKIPDSQDICVNSELNATVMPYGCQKFVEDKDGDGVSDDKDLCPSTPLGFAVNDDGCPLSKNLNIEFEPLSNKIAKTSNLKIKQFARFLKENPLYNIIIVGHTDNVGTQKENLKLSEERAKEVEKALESYGVDEARMSVVGKGEMEPIADNATPKGRRKNRRIEIRLNYVADKSGDQ